MKYVTVWSPPPAGLVLAAAALKTAREAARKAEADRYAYYNHTLQLDVLFVG